MFSKISTDFIWWFDDDSYLEQPNTFDTWVKQARTASPNTVMWGQIAQCDKPEFFSEGIDVLDFVRTASWYRGMPPPSWRPGGKGEFDYRGLGVGDGSWLFILGGCWLIRTAAVRALDWPDPRLAKMGDDVFLGEAIRQQGWTLENQREAGLVINAGKPRGNPGPARP
jgi:GT2 family glycosyltransferase